jgi:hypothetical protein
LPAGPSRCCDQVDGGTGYYGKYLHRTASSKQLLSDRVWFEGVHNRATTPPRTHKSGINTYVAITSNSSLSTVTNSRDEPDH